MEENIMGHRLPKRQLVYPFLELPYQEHTQERDHAEITPPSTEDHLRLIEGKPAGPNRLVE